MAIELPPLPYDLDALEPHISKETLEYHYGKHHQAYVTKLNELLPETHLVDKSLEEIIMQSQGPIFNNAAQVWNHSFYWKCMTPESKPAPSGELLQKITSSFGSLDHFQAQLSQLAISTFGSGWAWLVQNQAGALELLSTSNADTPIKHNKKALLTIDVWEHAYYIDYRNARPKYIENFWSVVNWDFVESQL